MARQARSRASCRTSNTSPSRPSTRSSHTASCSSPTSTSPRRNHPKQQINTHITIITSNPPPSLAVKNWPINTLNLPPLIQIPDNRTRQSPSNIHPSRTFRNSDLGKPLTRLLNQQGPKLTQRRSKKSRDSRPLKKRKIIRWSQMCKIIASTLTIRLILIIRSPRKENSNWSKAVILIIFITKMLLCKEDRRIWCKTAMLILEM